MAQLSSAESETELLGLIEYLITRHAVTRTRKGARVVGQREWGRPPAAPRYPSSQVSSLAVLYLAALVPTTF